MGRWEIWSIKLHLQNCFLVQIPLAAQESVDKFGLVSFSLSYFRLLPFFCSPFHLLLVVSLELITGRTCMDGGMANVCIHFLSFGHLSDLFIYFS